MHIFKHISGGMPPGLPRAFSCFSVSFKLVLLKKKKKRLKTMWKLRSTPLPALKNLATSLSAVYQHFPNEGNKFCNKVAVKDSQDCDAIL